MWGGFANGCDLLALVAVVGALVQAGWLFPAAATPTPGTVAMQLSRRADGYLCGALAWLALTTAVALPVRSADISGLPLDQLGPVLPLVLGRTYFGHVWLLRVAVLVALWIAWRVSRTPRRRRAFVCCALVGVLLEAWGWSVNAHPGDHGGFTLDVWMALLHIFAAGLWGGTVLAVAIVTVPVRLRLGALEADAVLPFVRRLSAVSAAGLALVVASGVYNAWVQLGQLSDFWASTYGRVLDVKLALVLVLATLGAGNRFWRVPRVLRAYRAPPASTAPALRQQALWLLLRAVAWEAVVLLAVVTAVAVLVNTMPPAAAGAMPMQ